METYDYLIIGSGAAGAIVANRLSSALKGSSIGVLEAGPGVSNLYSRIPAAFSKNLQNRKLMWQFKSAPTEQLGGRSVYLPQGKTLGGSTSINGLVYNRGLAADYDHWQSLGNEGWGYRDVLPYFRRSENRVARLTIPDANDDGAESGAAATTEAEPAGPSQYRGSYGPLNVSDPDVLHPVCDAFIATVAGHGFPAHNDYNGATQRGTGYFQRMIFKGKRVSTATAFLEPVKDNSNLTLHSGVQVKRILFENRRATGVETVDGRVMYANKEVICSAGTVNTTRILQLSGVGPGSLLQQFSIPVVHDLPGVGENFQDHYFVRMAARLKAGTPSLNLQSRGLSLFKQVLAWQMGKPSILSYSPSIAYAFLNSANLQDETPDLQFVFTPGSYKAGKVYVLDKFAAATCGFTQQRPESKGYIRISGTDPNDAPEVQPNYLEHETDRQTVIRGLKLCRQFLQSGKLGELYEREEVPGAQAQSDEELLQFARETGNTGYHLCGSCSMGPESNPLAVVGADLKVHGLEGLRVIDASVMPRVTSSNTCAASMMIGEKGADMIIAAAGSQVG